jgi:zinc protease
MEPLTGEHTFTVNKGKDPKAMVNDMAYFYTPYNSNDELSLNVLSEVINNRITDIIREKMSAIYGGGVGLRVAKFPKEKFSLQSYLPCGPENAEKVRTAFWEILSECKKPGNITADEITKAVQVSIQKYKVGVKTNGFWLGTLSKYQQNGIPTENILNFETRIGKITPAVLEATANKYLNLKNIVHSTLMPE